MVFYFTATGNSLYVAKCIDEYPVSIPQVIKNSSIYSDNQIVLTDYAQRRSKKCEYCLACVHACPQKAIIIKHEKNKNERYRNENVSLDEIIKSNFQDRRKCYE